MKATLLGLLSITAFSSCNTAIGLGRDMRVLGTEMEKKVDEAHTGGSGSADGYSEGGAPVY